MKVNLQTRVNLGMKLLDANYPNWHKKIKLGDMFSLVGADSCILGQIYGTYTEGLKALGIANGSEDIVEELKPGVKYGFWANSHMEATCWFKQIETLEALWTKAIAKRKMKKKVKA